MTRRQNDARTAGKWIAGGARGRQVKALRLMERHDPPITEREARAAHAQWVAEDQAAHASATPHVGHRPV